MFIFQFYIFLDEFSIHVFFASVVMCSSFFLLVFKILTLSLYPQNEEFVSASLHFVAISKLPEILITYGH